MLGRWAPAAAGASAARAHGAKSARNVMARLVSRFILVSSKCSKSNRFLFPRFAASYWLHHRLDALRLTPFVPVWVADANRVLAGGKDRRLELLAGWDAQRVEHLAVLLADHLHHLSA